MAVFVPFIVMTVAPHITTNTVDNMQCLGVLAEFLDCRIITEKTSPGKEKRYTMSINDITVKK